MNRAERRKLGIKKAEPIINIKAQDIQYIKEKAVADGCKRAFFLMLAIPTMVIHDKFAELESEENRENTFVNLCTETYAAYEQGYVSLEDLRKCLEEEAKIKININK